MQKNSAMLLPLTGLRFFAAGMIVLLHGSEYYPALRPFSALVDLNQAVSFFFILSGFILSYVYIDLDKKSFPKFLLARFARLWPAHLATAILVMIIVPRRLTNATHEAPLMLIPLAQLLMVHAWIPLKKFYASLNSVSWSISTEFFFYLLFPWFQASDNKRLVQSFTASLVFILVVIGITSALQVPYTAGQHETSLLALLYVSPFCRILEFIAGMITYRLYRHWQTRLAESAASAAASNLSRTKNARATGLELLALILLAISMIASTHITGTMMQTAPGLATFLGKYGVTLPFFAFFIYVMAQGRGWLSVFFSLKPLVFLGEISYAMYLLHLPLFWSFKDKPIPLPLYVFILITGSFLIWRLVEMPLRRFMVTQGAAWLAARTTPDVVTT